MKYAMSVLMVVCCALALVSSSAFADEISMPAGRCGMMRGCMPAGMGPEMGRPERGHGEMFLHMTGFILAKATEIGLTEDQISKIEALRYGIEKSSIKQNADVAVLDLDIRQAFKGDSIDATAVSGLIDQKYALKAQKAKDDVAAFASLKKIISKDQEKKLKDLCSSDMMGRKHLKEKEVE